MDQKRRGQEGRELDEKGKERRGKNAKGRAGRGFNWIERIEKESKY
jgi:hypothetical protein